MPEKEFNESVALREFRRNLLGRLRTLDADRLYYPDEFQNIVDESWSEAKSSAKPLDDE